MAPINKKIFFWCFRRSNHAKEKKNYPPSLMDLIRNISRIDQIWQQGAFCNGFLYKTEAVVLRGWKARLSQLTGSSFLGPTGLVFCCLSGVQ